MDNTQNLGQPVGKVTTTYNGEKIQVNVYADRSVILPDGTVRKVKQEVVDALRARGELPDARYETLAAFAREVIATRGNVSEATYQAFRAAGFSEGNALEVILGVSLATLCNFANVFAQTPLNEELGKYRWQPSA